MQLEVGAIFNARVTAITKFGAFVAVDGGRSGLVHISEVANTYVGDVNEFLSVGQEVRVRLISINDNGKLNFSIKKAVENPPEERRDNGRAAKAENEPHRPADMDGDAARFFRPEKSEDKNFEDKLKRFMQDSDRRISDSRIYDAQRRGGRRRK